MNRDLFVKITPSAAEFGSQDLIETFDDLRTDRGGVFVGQGLFIRLIHQAEGEALLAGADGFTAEDIKQFHLREHLAAALFDDIDNFFRRCALIHHDGQVFIDTRIRGDTG